LSPRYTLSELLAGLWAASWAFTVPEVPLMLAAALALLAPLVSATHSYRASMRRANLDCSPQAHAAMTEHSMASHTYLGALRCGWCAVRLPA
jgi:hypothetical protein